MQSLWRDKDAEALIARYGADGIGRDIALCLYMTRLLGGDRRLVLHGGGNSSVKTQVFDVAGTETEVLCVKASGSDMARAEPRDLPALRLAELRRLRDEAGRVGLKSAMTALDAALGSYRPGS